MVGQLSRRQYNSDRTEMNLLNNPAICYRSMNNIVFMTTVLLIGNELQNWESLIAIKQNN